MKEIKAIIRPMKLLEVLEELQRIEGLPGVIISEVHGFGKNMSKNAKNKIVREMIEMVPRTQLEVVVDDYMVDEVVDLIQKYSHTGNTGDGKIFVTNIEEIIKIRTNERGKDAL